jgi:hypothetical protein
MLVQKLLNLEDLLDVLLAVGAVALLVLAGFEDWELRFPESKDVRLELTRSLR